MIKKGDIISADDRIEKYLGTSFQIEVRKMKKNAHLYVAAVYSLLPLFAALLIFRKVYTGKNPFDNQDFVLGVLLTVLIMPTFYFLAVWISWLLEDKEKQMDSMDRRDPNRQESTNHNKKGLKGRQLPPNQS